MSKAKYLHIQAERCFHLAKGTAGLQLADELEALGRALDGEAGELELATGRHQVASHAAEAA